MSYDLAGQRFGKLIVRRRAPTPDGAVLGDKLIRWVCQCDCGKMTTVRSRFLRTGHTKSCGCARRRIGAANPKWEGHGDISGNQWTAILWNAKARGMLVTITIADAWDQFVRQGGRCALSGIRIYHKFKGRSDKTASLDRIDGDLGYIPGNVQWVHKELNRIKSDLSEREFLMWCMLVARHARKRTVRSAPRQGALFGGGS